MQASNRKIENKGYSNYPQDNQPTEANPNRLGRVLAPDSSPFKPDQSPTTATATTTNQSPNPDSTPSTPTRTPTGNRGANSTDNQAPTHRTGPLETMSSERYRALMSMSKSKSSSSSSSSSSSNNNPPRPTSSSSIASNKKRSNDHSSTTSKPIKNPRVDLSSYSSTAQQLPKKQLSASASPSKNLKTTSAQSSSESDTNDDEDADDDQESRAANDGPPRKKKRFQRGGRKTPPLESPIRSTSTSHSTENNSLASTLNGSTSASATSSVNSPSQNNASSTTSNGVDPQLLTKARRLSAVLSKQGHVFTPEQAAEVLKSCRDTTKAMEICKEKYPKGAAKPFSNNVGGSNSRTSTPTPAASVVPTNRKKTVHDDDDERDAYAGDSDDGNGAQDEEEKQARAAIKWFNECDEGALIDTTGCTVNQAATIMRLRPFEDVEDAENRLDDKANKGVTSKLFTNCLELMAGYYEVDNVLEKCEKIGAELHLAMAAWNIQPMGGPSRSATPGTTPGTPKVEGLDADEVPDKSSTQDTGVLSLSSVSNPELIRDPDYLHGQPENLGKGVVLKDYQLVGVNWLSLLYRKQTSAILADEMGLGKTAQVIAFLTTLQNKGIKGPHLIVVPSSVLENWNREFKLFAPKIHVRSYYGSQNERRDLRDELKADKDLDVVLTTYDIAAGSELDHKFLKRRDFNVCVFDEGHMLKNRKSQKYEKLLRISAKWRLLLTGTPLQNNLQELISLLNFIMPEYFKDAEEALTAIFKVKPGAQKNELSKQRVERARKMMQPFVLRRKKDKVLTELCSKTERVEFCEMTKPQKKLYQDALRRTQKVIVEEVGDDDGDDDKKSKPVRAASRIRGGKAAKENGSGNILMDLRKAANHPLLFREYYNDSRIAALAKDYVKEPEHADENLQHLKEDFGINSDAQLSLLANSWPFTQKHKLPNSYWMDSGKIQALKRLIPEIQAKGDRILIFSQFTTVLDILCVALDIMGVKYVGFTGQTNVGDRQHLVDQFTNDESITVFLLSTKAGGLGINLVAANWVIMYDQDFNPQNDKQAADRCYRMGQTKEVTVVKLISRDTIDESMHDLGKRKLELANRVSGEGIEAEEGEEVGKSLEKSLLSELKKKMTANGASESISGGEEKVEQL